MSAAFDPIAHFNARLRAAQDANPGSADEDLLAGLVSKLGAEIRNERRDSVRPFYEAMLAEAKRQLAEIAPGHFLMSDSVPVDEPVEPIDTSPDAALRAEIDRLLRLRQLTDSPGAMAGIESTINRWLAQAGYAPMFEPRPPPGSVPQFSHQQNVTGAFRRRQPVRETELLGAGDPLTRHLANRRVVRAELQRQHEAAQRGFGGYADTSPVPTASPTGDLT